LSILIVHLRCTISLTTMTTTNHPMQIHALHPPSWSCPRLRGLPRGLVCPSRLTRLSPRIFASQCPSSWPTLLDDFVEFRCVACLRCARTISCN
jgi:hypothetical protein